MTIKAGDSIVLKKEFSHRNIGYSFPLKVEKIDNTCANINNIAYLACMECPGYINDNICFGDPNGYLVESIKDWDD